MEKNNDKVTKGKKEKFDPERFRLQKERDDENKLALQNKVSGYEAQLLKRFEPDFIKKIKMLCYYLSQVGFDVKEACFLSDLTEIELEKAIKKEPLIKKLIEIKMLEFKKDLLTTLSAKARSGDDKMSQWLLEKLFPEEFGTKKGGGGDGNENLIRDAVKFIQENAAKDSPLIDITNNKPADNGSGKGGGTMKKIFNALK